MTRGRGIGGHTRPNRGACTEWQTPPEILAALGPFDDDPCTPDRTDGLTRPWHGFVWLNPPYGRDMWPWLARLYEHAIEDQGGIAVIFARTETRGFIEWVWHKSTGMLFLAGRPHFYRAGVRARGNCGGPLVLVAYGRPAWKRLWGCTLPGTLITSTRTQPENPEWEAIS